MQTRTNANLQIFTLKLMFLFSRQALKDPNRVLKINHNKYYSVIGQKDEL